MLDQRARAQARLAAVQMPKLASVSSRVTPECKNKLPSAAMSHRHFTIRLGELKMKLSIQ